MPITLTPEQESRVKQKVAIGQFNSAEEVLDVALRLVEENYDGVPLTREELQREIAIADAQFAQGKYQTYDRASLPALLGRLKLDKRDASELAYVLISLYVTCASGKVSLAEFVDQICEALASTNDEQLAPIETTESHPLASLAGKYHSEPLWDDFMQAIRENRREMNEQEDVME